MKKWLCLILALLLLASQTACANEKQTVQEPVNFYYRQITMEYGTDDGVIGKESREGKDHLQDYPYLLSLYLKGPESDLLYSPFPSNTALESFSIEDQTAIVQLNSAFAVLTGLELSIACACITMTVCDLAKVNAVTVFVSGAMLDGNHQITLSRNDLLLLDDSSIVIDPN